MRLFNSHLDGLEKTLIIPISDDLYVQEITLGNNYENHVLALSHEESNFELTVTALKALSLQYRIETLKKSEPDSLLSGFLINALKKWKQGIELYIDKEATANDLKKLNELSRYTRFVDVLLKNLEVQDECFKLIIRDHFPIKILVQYFKTCAIDLKNALLTMRAGFFEMHGCKKLKIVKMDSEEGKIKDLQFEINHKFVSVLNDSAIISLNGGVSHTWRKLKNLCEIAKKLPAQVEVFEEGGLLLWCPQGLKYHENGDISAIDTKQSNYWEDQKLPVFLTLSKEKIEKMLHITITDEKPCIATIEASCIDPFHVDNAHGASTIYLPIGNDQYRVFPFGKYAKKFPQTDFEKLCFLGDTVEAELTYPDPTPFYTQRIHGVVPYLLTQDEAELFLKKYGLEIKDFQFSGNNCSADFQRIFEETFGKEEEGGLIPNFFRQPLVESKFFFPANYVFGAIQGCDPRIAFIFLHGIHLLCGSKREYSRQNEEKSCIETRSLYNSEFCDTQNLYVPGRLVYRILTREIKGITYFGYD